MFTPDTFYKVCQYQSSTVCRLHIIQCLLGICRLLSAKCCLGSKLVFSRTADSIRQCLCHLNKIVSLKNTRSYYIVALTHCTGYNNEAGYSLRFGTFNDSDVSLVELESAILKCKFE